MWRVTMDALPLPDPPLGPGPPPAPVGPLPADPAAVAAHMLHMLGLGAQAQPAPQPAPSVQLPKAVLDKSVPDKYDCVARTGEFAPWLSRLEAYFEMIARPVDPRVGSHKAHNPAWSAHG